MTANEEYQAIIIGSGPGGVSCALELHDSRVKCLILERAARIGDNLGSLKNTIKNLVGGFFESGEHLRQATASLVDRVACPYLVNHEVTRADLAGRLVEAGGKIFSAQAIVIATGLRRRRLALTGEKAFPEDVLYEMEGHESALRGQAVAVVGGGDSAVLDAIELSRMCPHVFLIHRGDRLRAREDILRDLSSVRNLEVFLTSEVIGLDGADRLRAVRLKSGTGEQSRTLDATRLVVKIGYAPNTEIFKGQVDMDPEGHIRINQDSSTSAPGIYAVGDITTPGYPRIATAAGQGFLAAAAIRRLLSQV